MNNKQEEKLEELLLLATAGDDKSIELVIEAIGNDDFATRALVEFMDGFTVGNPTLMQLQYNQQLGDALFKHIADHIVSD